MTAERQRYGSIEASAILAILFMFLGSLGETLSAQTSTPPSTKGIQDIEKALQTLHDRVGQFFRLYNAGNYTAALEIALENERQAADLSATIGAKNPLHAATLKYLAVTCLELGKFSEGEKYLRRGLEVSEATYGPTHLYVAENLHNLGETLRQQGRGNEAEQFFRQALDIHRAAAEPNQRNVASSAYNLANVLAAQRRFGEALKLFNEALEILDRQPMIDHKMKAHLLTNMGVLNSDMENYVEAERILLQAQNIQAAHLPSEHPNHAFTLRALTGVYVAQKRWDDARLASAKVLSIEQTSRGNTHPAVIQALDDLANVTFLEMYRAAPDLLNGRDDATNALLIEKPLRQYLSYRRAAGEKQIVRRSIVDASEWSRGRIGKAIENRSIYQKHLAALSLARLMRLEPEQELILEAFAISQRSDDSSAAAALQRSTARLATGSGDLARTIRAIQDLEQLWVRLDGQLTVALAKRSQNESGEVVSNLREKISNVEQELAQLQLNISRQFPAYGALANSSPLTIGEVQRYLVEKEALIYVSYYTDMLNVWVVTRQQSRWLSTPIKLTEEIAALRCGLDFEGAWGARDSRCATLLNASYTRSDYEAGKPLPFEPARAHVVYKALFGGIEDLIKDKNLLIVPSGALTQLPFQVLVTSVSNPPGLTPGQNPWLIRRHAITVLPAVSSLKALRQNAKASRAAKPFAGIGNPLLDGPDRRYEVLKQAALKNKTCGALAKTQVAEGRGGGISPVLLRGGVANVDELRRAAPLPETAEELCDVAKSIGVDEVDVFLGSRANESEIKWLSEAGLLSDYRILHFATHGALAGEVSGSSEPGLLLTPPIGAGTEMDDGYLSTSEIAALKLDTDWVILSACNTAGGAKEASSSEGAEALSGLARAFFYAGARALLVSHWYVDSAATVALIKGAFAEMKADPRLGRAEAMRRSMLKLADSGDARLAQPAAWAPFVVVGEGAGVQ